MLLCHMYTVKSGIPDGLGQEKSLTVCFLAVNFFFLIWISTLPRLRFSFRGLPVNEVAQRKWFSL